MGSLDILQGLFFQWYVSRAQCTISRENFLNILLYFTSFKSELSLNLRTVKLIKATLQKFLG